MSAAAHPGEPAQAPVAISPGASYDAQAEASMAYHDANVDLKLMPWDGHRYRLLVKDRISAAELIDLPEDLEHIETVQRVIGNKAVLIGSIEGSGQEVVVLDWIQHRLLDRFWCYAPLLSPDQRYLAFVKFHPAHIVDGISDSQYRLYDLQADNSGARLQAHPPESDPPADAGAVVYPLSADAIDRSEAQLSAANTHRTVAFDAYPTFFWASDSRRFAFGDVQNGTLNLVLVSLRGKAPPEVRSFRLANTELIAPDVAADDLGLAAVSFGAAKLQARWVSQRNPNFANTLSIPLDQFRATSR